MSAGAARRHPSTSAHVAWSVSSRSVGAVGAVSSGFGAGAAGGDATDSSHTDWRKPRPTFSDSQRVLPGVPRCGHIRVTTSCIKATWSPLLCIPLAPTPCADHLPQLSPPYSGLTSTELESFQTSSTDAGSACGMLRVDVGPTRGQRRSALLPAWRSHRFGGDWGSVRGQFRASFSGVDKVFRGGFRLDLGPIWGGWRRH